MAGRVPRFLVQSDDLPRILPLQGAVSVGDERGVSARLEALEHSQRKSMDEMKKMITAMVTSQQMKPAVAVAPPVRPSNPGVVVSAPLAPETTTYASMISQPSVFSRQPRQLSAGRQNIGRTERSPLVKQGRANIAHGWVLKVLEGFGFF